MKKKSKKSPNLEITQQQLTYPEMGQALWRYQHTNGMASFSVDFYEQPEFPVTWVREGRLEYAPASTIYAEPYAMRNLSIADTVLQGAGVGLETDPDKQEALERRLFLEVCEKLDTEKKDALEQTLVDFRSEEKDKKHIVAFLRAIWAELYHEPLSPVWLAALAVYALFVQGQGQTFGYLVATLEHKLKSEPDFLRGKGSVESAAKGGRSRAGSTSGQTEQVLSAMDRLVEDKNESVSNAARLAHTRGIGTSIEANRALWKRHRGTTNK